MRILSVGIGKDIISQLSIKTNTIIDESYNIKDSEHFTRSRDYCMFLLNYERNNNKMTTFMKTLSHSYKKSPIIVFHPYQNKNIELSMLKGGADDFIITNTDLDIVATKIERKIRNCINNITIIKNFKINFHLRSLTFKEKTIYIKEKMFKLIEYFLLNHNKLLSKDDIICAIYYEPEFVTNRTLELLVSDLSKLLLDEFGIKPIENNKKSGYRFLDTC